MEYNKFSFKEYKNIIKKYKDITVDYTEVSARNNFCVIRHDVEFSLERAVQIAKIDYDLNIESSFLIQVRSGFYNALAYENVKKILEIKSLGRKIGLHLYCTDIAQDDWESLESSALAQKHVLESIVGPIDRFSYHRPPDWVLKENADVLFSMINCYGKSYFEFTKQEPLHIKYMADSRHKFAYGHPLDSHPQTKFQLLLHPDEWTTTGFNKQQNFELILKERLDYLKSVIKRESK